MGYVRDAYRPAGATGAPKLGPVYDASGCAVVGFKLQPYSGGSSATYYPGLVVTAPSSATAGAQYTVKLKWDGNAHGWFTAPLC